MNNRITPDEARAALDSAVTASGRVRAQARWMSTYMAVFAVAFLLLTLVVGLVESTPIRLTVGIGGWFVLVVVMMWWISRRTAMLTGSAWRTAPYWLGTVLLYTAALIVGLPDREGQVTYWVPAAIIVALPMAIGALLERRR
jgi:hypothetical protein